MTDELFQAYKAKVSELLKAKVPFGEHQRQAFETVVGPEINRLETRCALLQSLLGEGIRAGYFDPAKCSPELAARSQPRNCDIRWNAAQKLMNQRTLDRDSPEYCIAALHSSGHVRNG